MLLCCSPGPLATAEDAFKNVQYVKNYDGDTVTVNIPGVHPVLGKEIPVRIKGIDTPELRTNNKCEKRMAAKARDMVSFFLRSASVIDLKSVTRGKYFRLVADVYIDGASLGELLTVEGLAVPYKDRKRVRWCRMERNLE